MRGPVPPILFLTGKLKGVAHDREKKHIEVKRGLKNELKRRGEGAVE